MNGYDVDDGTAASHNINVSSLGTVTMLLFDILLMLLPDDLVLLLLLFDNVFMLLLMLLVWLHI